MAGICKAMADRADIADPDKIFAAGLLHNVRKAVLEAGGGIGRDDLGAFYATRWCTRIAFGLFIF